MSSFSIVIPTIGRASLGVLLDSLAACDGPLPEHVVVVDDRRAPDPPLSLDVDGWPSTRLRVLSSDGRGPAAARNAGWRSVHSEWVCFLDDDVTVPRTWLTCLAEDLAAATPDVAASQARIEVPLPSGRAPTDWERGTYGLSSARWITADMAYRHSVLEQVRGFDERFGRAFREDADLALRVMAEGHRLVVGTRQTTHPVRRARWTASLGQQRGNADDALMRALHGADWYERAGASVGRRGRHVATVAAAGLAVVTSARRRRTSASAAAAWAVLTGEFAWKRIAAGPRTPREVATMAATSLAIPPAAVAHLVRGTLRYRGAPPWTAIAPPLQPPPGPAPIEAVLFDRDGTLIRDVPYNGRPERVEPLPGVEQALARLRAAGIKLGVITNQSGIARGLLDADELRAVNARVEELLGPFDTWQVCPHGEQDNCACRKPGPGLVRAAAAELGLPTGRCAVVGDIGSDVQAGIAAGAGVTILVPTAATRPEEVADAPLVFATLAEATDELIINHARGFLA